MKIIKVLILAGVLFIGSAFSMATNLNMCSKEQAEEDEYYFFGKLESDKVYYFPIIQR